MSTVIRVISSFVVNKLIALYVGPAGLAIIGNLQNFISILSGLATGSINSGVVKYTAEYSGDAQQLKLLFSSSVRFVVICSALVGSISIAFSKYFSLRILHDVSYAYLFIAFGITVFLFSFNTIILSILNGKKEIRKFTLANIISSIVSLVLTSILLYYQRINGALLSLVISQACIFIVALYFLFRCKWFSSSMLFGRVDKEIIKKLLRYSIMGITSVIVVPTSLLLIRNLITREVSVESAGLWEAINRISSIYLMVITASLAVYYVPKLSETHNTIEIRKEIFSGFKIIMPVVICMSASIFLLRFFIIRILFTHQFEPMEPLFLFQLIGDNIKIASWLFAFLMIAKAMTKLFIITEITFSLSYYLLSVYFVSKYGAVGATYAYAINYTGYLITCFLALRRRIGF